MNPDTVATLQVWWLFYLKTIREIMNWLNVLTELTLISYVACWMLYFLNLLWVCVHFSLLELMMLFNPALISPLLDQTHLYAPQSARHRYNTFWRIRICPQWFGLIPVISSFNPCFSPPVAHWQSRQRKCLSTFRTIRYSTSCVPTSLPILPYLHCKEICFGLHNG